MNKSRKYSGQRFAYDIDLVLKLVNILVDDSTKEKTNKALSNYLKIGVPKVQAFMNYAELSGLINKRKITDFGNYILKLVDYPDIYQPLLYYKLCRGWENGGHFYYSRIVNNILYNRYFSAENTIENSEIKDKLLDFKSEYEKLDVKLVSLVTKGISSNEGFGYLGILNQESRSKYTIYSYRPNHLVCTYIIYDRWPKGSTTVSFDSIVYDEYNLGRIFFLTENEVIAIFSKLQQENYIKIEDKAGLRQIAKNPNITTDNILEEILNEYFSNTFSG